MSGSTIAEEGMIPSPFSAIKKLVDYDNIAWLKIFA